MQIEISRSIRFLAKQKHAPEKKCKRCRYTLKIVLCSVRFRIILVYILEATAYSYRVMLGMGYFEYY